MKRSRRIPAIVLVASLALAAPLSITAPVTALGETLADLSAGLLHEPGSRFGPRHEYASRPLRVGDRGTDVAVLQRLLTRVGPHTEVTGTYGTDTRRSVRRWKVHTGQRRGGAVSRGDARRLRAQLTRGATRAFAPGSIRAVLGR